MATEPNLLLDALIEQAGLSHAGFAARLNTCGESLGLRYDHASVARWIRDHAIPRSPVPSMICEVLGERLGVRLTLADIGMDRRATAGSNVPLNRAVDQATALWRGDLTRSADGVATKLLTGSDAVAPVWDWENPPDDRDVSRPGHRPVSMADVQRLRAARDRYQEMYRRVGGVPVRPRIVHLLHSVGGPLLRAAYDNAVGRDLYRAVGGLAALAGVCAYDADQQPLAQRHLHHALRLAKASGDRGFGGYIVALLATQSLHVGEYRLVVQYAQTALRAAGSQLTPALTADLHTLAAKAYARMHDSAGCHEHMRLSEKTAIRIDPHGEPAEVSYVQPGLVECQHAEALRRLGDLSTAQTLAEESVRTLDAIHLRGRVHRLAGLALILTARGDVDRSAHIAGQMLDNADGMESGRIRDRVATVVNALKPHAAEPSVAEVLRRYRYHAGYEGVA
ncbi:hypothetical protein ACNTMW_31080 [Planosporangium sp. 12N6]|uniref:hypothetical protein n=1 Tax=Planosporangium spinosum TaxID=3402278 RepID=UPI003CFA4333